MESEYLEMQDIPLTRSYQFKLAEPNYVQCGITRNQFRPSKDERRVHFDIESPPNPVRSCLYRPAETSINHERWFKFLVTKSVVSSFVSVAGEFFRLVIIISVVLLLQNGTLQLIEAAIAWYNLTTSVLLSMIIQTGWESFIYAEIGGAILVLLSNGTFFVYLILSGSDIPAWIGLTSVSWLLVVLGCSLRKLIAVLLED